MALETAPSINTSDKKPKSPYTGGFNPDAIPTNTDTTINVDHSTVPGSTQIDNNSDLDNTETMAVIPTNETVVDHELKDDSNDEGLFQRLKRKGGDLWNQIWKSNRPDTPENAELDKVAISSAEQIQQDAQSLHELRDDFEPKRSFRDKVGNFFKKLFPPKANLDELKPTPPTIEDITPQQIEELEKSGALVLYRDELNELGREGALITYNENLNRATGIEELKNTNTKDSARVLTKGKNIDWRKWGKRAGLVIGTAGAVYFALPAVLSGLGYAAAAGLMATGAIPSTAAAGAAIQGTAWLGGIGSFGSVGMATWTSGYGAFMGVNATAWTSAIAGGWGAIAVGAKNPFKLFRPKENQESEINLETQEAIDRVFDKMSEIIDEKYEYFPENNSGFNLKLKEKATEIYTNQVNSGLIQPGEDLIEDNINFNNLQINLEIYTTCQTEALSEKNNIFIKPLKELSNSEINTNLTIEDTVGKIKNIAKNAIENEEITNDFAQNKESYLNSLAEILRDITFSDNQSVNDIIKGLYEYIISDKWKSDEDETIYNELVEAIDKLELHLVVGRKFDLYNNQENEKISDLEVIGKLTDTINQRIIQIDNDTLGKFKESILKSTQETLNEDFHSYSLRRSEEFNPAIANQLSAIDRFIETKAWEQSSPDQIKAFFEIRLRELDKIANSINGTQGSDLEQTELSDVFEGNDNASPELLQILASAEKPNYTEIVDNPATIKAELDNNSEFLQKQVGKVVDSPNTKFYNSISNSGEFIKDAVVLASSNEGSTLIAYRNNDGIVETAIVDYNDLTNPIVTETQPPKKKEKAETITIPESPEEQAKLLLDTINSTLGNRPNGQNKAVNKDAATSLIDKLNGIINEIAKKAGDDYTNIKYGFSDINNMNGSLRAAKSSIDSGNVAEATKNIEEIQYNLNSYLGLPSKKKNDFDQPPINHPEIDNNGSDDTTSSANQLNEPVIEAPESELIIELTPEQKFENLIDSQLNDLIAEIKSEPNSEIAAFDILSKEGKLADLTAEIAGDHDIAGSTHRSIEFQLEEILTTQKLEQMGLPDTEANREQNRFDLSTISETDDSGNSTWDISAKVMVAQAFNELVKNIKGQPIDSIEVTKNRERTLENRDSEPTIKSQFATNSPIIRNEEELENDSSDEEVNLGESIISISKLDQLSVSEYNEYHLKKRTLVRNWTDNLSILRNNSFDEVKDITLKIKDMITYLANFEENTTDEKYYHIDDSLISLIKAVNSKDVDQINIIKQNVVKEVYTIIDGLTHTKSESN